MEKLRKVEFTLEQQEMNLADYGHLMGEPDEKTKETLKKRKGLFHCFGNEPFYDAGAECLRDRIVGIIEEGTGQVFHIVPQFIRFEQ